MMMQPRETLTAGERGDVEDLPGRQSGCPDPTCSVCIDNKRREAALHKALRIIDAHESDRAELEAEVSYLRDVLDLVAKYADTYGADLIPHGPDSYGEGIRAAKGTIKKLLAHKAAKKETTR